MKEKDILADLKFACLKKNKKAAGLGVTADEINLIMREIFQTKYNRKTLILGECETQKALGNKCNYSSKQPPF